MKLIHDWFDKPEFRRTLLDALGESDPYRAVLDQGLLQPLATLSFCSLLVCGCVEMREQLEAGEPRRSYRLRDDVVIALLNPVDRIVAERMQAYHHVYEIIPDATDALSATLGAFSALRQLFTVNDGCPDLRQRMAAQFDQIMMAALEHNAPAGCGV